ncbi:hypothetical protein ACFRAE_13190 [Sphingobacterium sp. HJSM2_6]|uniref:hypothetical protein n=1 Tax=Sphingobacterium sp. HJSM2_6 TaxID=3366264 RepID=UPI003BC86CE6
MKILISIGLLLSSFMGMAQTEHIQRLELGKKQKKLFNRGDSSMTIIIDTLIMADRSKLEFFGKKDVKLEIGYAEIGNNVVIFGQDSKNNASNLDIKVNIQKLGSLFLIGRGNDAMNGTKTYPNGNGAQIKLAYNTQGIQPQMTNKKGKNFLFVDVEPGGLRSSADNEIRQIYSRISLSSPGLRGLPQGQIYSGSPGNQGKFELVAY